MLVRLATIALIVTTLGMAAMADQRRVSENKDRDFRHDNDRDFHVLRHHDDHHKTTKSVTSVSEPGSFLLLGTGLLAGWAALKRRTRID